MTPIKLVLDKLPDAKKSGNGWQAPCPAHDDHKPSLSITQAEDGKVLLMCQAGCSVNQVVAGLGLKMSDLFPPRKANGKSAILATYPYHDERGKVLYEVVRLKPKDFRQRQPDGRGGWRWNMKGVRRVLYRLPELLAAKKSAWTNIAEGEKDVDHLVMAGLTATCNVGGAGKWKSEYNETLRGRRVCIIADKDKSGRDHAQQVAKSLYGTASEIRVLELPGDGVKDSSDWFDAGGTKEAMIALVEQAPPWNPAEAQGIKTVGARGLQTPEHPYRETNGGIYRIKSVDDADVPIQLTNFTARIVANVVRDDGTETQAAFEIEAQLNQRRQAFTIPAARFSTMNWPTEHLGAEAIVYPGQAIKDHTRAAIQLLSPPPISRRTIFTHTGWRQLDGQWVYLHGGGGIAASGHAEGVAVDLPAALAPYTLPDPPSADSLRDAVRASLGILKLASDDIVLTAYCAVWRAALGTCDFGIHLAGASGVFKSELAALLQQHFGAGLDARHLPGSWHSTDNALEGLLFSVKDAITVVDDFAPQGGPHDIARWHQRADRIIRAQGNNAGKGRMFADGSLRPPKPPRGLVLSTGEDIPKGQSLRARMLIVEISSGDISKQALTRCQQDARAGLYATAMAGFVRWLADRYGKLSQGLRAEMEALRQQAADSNAHNRTPEIVANLAIGLRYFLDFAVDAGAIDETESQQFWQRGWVALGQASAKQVAHQNSSEPARRFVELLTSALASGHAHLADPDGNAPPNAAAWGWRLTDRGWQAQGDRVGWIDRDELLLDPDASYRAAQNMAGPSGDGLSVSVQTLRKRLDEKRMVVRQKSTELVSVRVLEGRKQKVLHLVGGILCTESPKSPIPTAATVLDPANGDKSGIPIVENAPASPENHNGKPQANPPDGPENAAHEGSCGNCGKRKGDTPAAKVKVYL